jgi:hypothetical protein
MSQDGPATSTLKMTKPKMRFIAVTLLPGSGSLSRLLATYKVTRSSGQQAKSWMLHLRRWLGLASQSKTLGFSMY